jgi:hypothetical protein
MINKTISVVCVLIGWIAGSYRPLRVNTEVVKPVVIYTARKYVVPLPEGWRMKESNSDCREYKLNKEILYYPAESILRQRMPKIVGLDWWGITGDSTITLWKNSSTNWETLDADLYKVLADIGAY